MAWINKYSRYLKSRSVYGIDIIWNSDNDISCNVVELIKRKDQIEIVQQLSKLKSFENLFQSINNNHPITLNIDGKGLIHKQVLLESLTEGLANPEKLVHQVFPNFSENDFYIQQTVINPQLIYFTLVRKEFINKIMQYFIDKSFFVLNISLGPFVIQKFQHVLSAYDQLQTSNYILQLKDGEIVSFNKQQHINITSYIIGDENVSSDMLIAYAIGFSYYTHDWILLKTDEGKYYNEEYLYKRALKYCLYAAIIFLFIILLLNFLFLDKFNRLVIFSERQLEQRKELVDKVDLLKKEILTKESFFKSNRFLETSKVSYFADRLALSLPTGIVMNEIFFFPQERNQSTRDEFKFMGNLIRLSGTTYNTEELNTWFKKLKQENWIKTLTMTNLSQSEGSSETIFEMEITLK